MNSKNKIYYERGTEELRNKTFAHINLFENLIMLNLKKLKKRKKSLGICLEL